MAKQQVKKTWLDYLKQYWFIAFVCLGLVVYIAIYCVQAYQNRPIYVKAKKIDGDYAVFSIDDKYYMANELFEDAKSSNGNKMLKTNFYKDVLDSLYKTTDEMKTASLNYANYQLSNYSEEDLYYDLANQGLMPADLDTLKGVYITYLKGLDLIKDYFRVDASKATGYISNNNIRKISHILVKLNSVITNEDGTYKANPTEEETKKLNDVLEALKTQDFEEVAKTYSDDGSAQNGGFLGYKNIDNLSQEYVKEFADGALTVKDGGTTEAVLSQFGWHIIKVDKVEASEAIEETQFIADIYGTDQTILDTAMKNYALTKVEYAIDDETFKKYIEGSEE